jgi:acyl carrier protein
MSQVHQAEIRDFIVGTFLFGQGGDQINDRDSLLDKGVIDSTGVLELVNFVGEKYGIRVSDDELIADNFDSIDKLAAFVQRKSA